MLLPIIFCYISMDQGLPNIKQNCKGIKKMNGHHLILGELKDFITGKTLEDTHDERYRQKIARFLLEEKGFSRDSIRSRVELLVEANNRRAIIKIDFLVSNSGKTGMLIKYGPGSIITRHRLSLSASRITENYQIPVVVVTNGEQADILNGTTGKIINKGIDNIPSKVELDKIMKAFDFKQIDKKRKKMESKILFAFEVDGRCPCDDDICFI